MPDRFGNVLQKAAIYDYGAQTEVSWEPRSGSPQQERLEHAMALWSGSCQRDIEAPTSIETNLEVAMLNYKKIAFFQLGLSGYIYIHFQTNCSSKLAALKVAPWSINRS